MTIRAHVTGILAVLALIPATSMAQTPQNAQRINALGGTCGQPLALTYTLAIPIDTAPVAPLTAGTPRGEPYYLEFSLATETRVGGLTSTSDSATDPFLSVFDATGTLLASDDDGAGDYNAFFDLPLTRGTYCVQVRPYGSVGSIGEITLTLATGDAAGELVDGLPISTEHEEADYTALCTDPALTADLDGDLGRGMGTRSLAASFAPGSRQDWRLTVTEDLPIQFDATSTEFDTLLILVDANGTLVAENDDGAGGTDSQILARLQPGSYCLSLSGFDRSGGAATLTMTDEVANPPAGPITTACTDPSATSDFATPLATGMGSVSVPVMLQPNGRSDWRVEVTEAVEFQFDAKSAWIDTVLYIVDAQGNVVSENDDGPVSTDSRIVRQLQPGTYCLALASYGGEGGDAELVISDEISPEPIDISGVPGCSTPEMTAQIGQDIVPGMDALSLGVDVAANSRKDFTLNVPEAASVQIDATSGAFDTVLRLADANSTVIAENDDFDPGTDSRIEVELAAGNYCLTLEGFAGGSGPALLGIMVLDAETRDRLAVERGEVLPAAGTVEIEDLGTLETKLETNATTPEQTRWISFSVTEPGRVVINGVSASGGFTLRLFSEAGELLDSQGGSAGLIPAALRASLEPGRYVVGMSMDDGAVARLRNIVITRE